MDTGSRFSVFNPNHFIKKAEMYSKYIRFCRTDKFRFITNSKFNERMKEFGLTSDQKWSGGGRKGQTERVWIGCTHKDKLIPENQETF